MLVVCNYTSYQNLQKTSSPNPFVHGKAWDKAGTVSVHANVQVCIQNSGTVDSEHCFNLSRLISAVGVTDIYPRQYIPKKEFFLVVCDYQLLKPAKKTLCPTRLPVKKRGTSKSVI